MNRITRRQTGGVLAMLGGANEEKPLVEALSGTTSLPFPPGKDKRVAVKVMDPRGNEVTRGHKLN